MQFDIHFHGSALVEAKNEKEALSGLSDAVFSGIKPEVLTLSVVPDGINDWTPERDHLTLKEKIGIQILRIFFSRK